MSGPIAICEVGSGVPAAAATMVESKAAAEFGSTSKPADGLAAVLSCFFLRGGSPVAPRVSDWDVSFLRLLRSFVSWCLFLFFFLRSVDGGERSGADPCAIDIRVGTVVVRE